MNGNEFYCYFENEEIYIRNEYGINNDCLKGKINAAEIPRHRMAVVGWNPFEWIVWIGVVFEHWLLPVWREGVFECWKHFCHHHQYWTFHSHVYFDRQHHPTRYHSIRIRCWPIHEPSMGHNNPDATDLGRWEYWTLEWMEIHWWRDEDNRWPQWSLRI